MGNNNQNERPSSLSATMKEIRKELIDLYTNGPTEEDLNNIKQLQLEGKIDKNGFIKNEPVNITSTIPVSELRAKQSTWLKILKNWERYYPSKYLKKKVFGGIPECTRGEAWKRILEVPHEINANPDHYEHLKTIAKETSSDLYQIDLDINRTYRNHVMFRSRYSIKQRSLFYVLGAYAEHNKDVGYCQGMASVAALLLMYMNEEDAFWALSTLLTGKKYSMHGFFVPGFPKLVRFQNHHERIFQKLLPKLFTHFENQGIGPSLYTLKWYMQCFLDRLPFDLTLRLWDLFVLEGDKILHPIGYTLLKLHSKELLKMNMEQIAECLSSKLVNKTYDPDIFIDLVYENIVELKKCGLYPAPSVVEGELPLNSNMVFSTINEKNISKNRIAIQLLEIEENQNENKSDSLSVDDTISVSSYNRKDSYIDSTSINCSEIYNTKSGSVKHLPKVIPPPPQYPAPFPPIDIHSYVVPHDIDNLTYKKQRIRNKQYNTPRKKSSLSNSALTTKSLYIINSSNIYTNIFNGIDMPTTATNFKNRYDRGRYANSVYVGTSNYNSKLLLKHEDGDTATNPSDSHSQTSNPLKDVPKITSIHHKLRTFTPKTKRSRNPILPGIMDVDSPLENNNSQNNEKCSDLMEWSTHSAGVDTPPTQDQFDSTTSIIRDVDELISELSNTNLPQEDNIQTMSKDEPNRKQS